MSLSAMQASCLISGSNRVPSFSISATWLLFRQVRFPGSGRCSCLTCIWTTLRALTGCSVCSLIGRQTCNETSGDFSIIAAEWDLRDGLARSRFEARNKFVPETLGVETLASARLFVDPDFHVEAVELDHGIPCLAFAFQESMRVNVHKARLDELGLPVGPWLTEAKHLVRTHADPDTIVTISEHGDMKLGDLLSAKAFVTGPGERICYATDLAFTEANLSRLLALAEGSDYLFIEGGFLDEDKAIAASKRHLTALQAGSIAAAARVAICAHAFLAPLPRAGAIVVG